MAASKGDGGVASSQRFQVDVTGARPARLTLGQFVVLSFAGLAILLAVLLSVFYEGSRRTVLLASERLMGQASRRVNERISGHLGEAQRLVASFEAELALGLADASRPASVDSALVAALTAYPQITYAGFTHAHAAGVWERNEGEHEAGELRVAEEGRFETTASREGTGDAGAIVLRRAAWAGGVWHATVQRLPADPKPRADAPPVVDPTLLATFTVPSLERHRGRALWSDLSYAQADAALPVPERRRIVSVQKAIWTKTGEFVGVLKASLASDRLDELTRIRVDEWAGEDDPHVVFLCDEHGRAISRLGPRDRFALLDDSGNEDPDGDLRVVFGEPRPAVTAALRVAAVGEVPAGGIRVVRIDVMGVPYLASFATLPDARTRGWRIGIVVPESHYLRDLEASRRRALVLAAILMLAAFAVGALVLRALRRDLGAIVGETARLRHFEFTAAKHPIGAFRDVQAAAEGLEQAKTALRALGKYVPLDLVRQLYEERREPMLGGELREVTLLFSDVAGFTSISERLEPNRLARALGAYLETMTTAVHKTGGIIDKYTGDGVMALWNTPRACDGHPLRACEAALACLDGTARLFASPAWEDLDAWATRIGIHRDEVTVGHYGAPDRMSFTALGDGVNLASRLEGLNKLYGTRILVSAAIEREARGAFLFRRIDRVAVKGRREGIEVFELLGRRAEEVTNADAVESYERALDAYFARRFDVALDILAAAGANGSDPPSARLAERCRRFLAEPPPPDWSGVWVALEK